MWKIWANQLLPKALKRCPKSNKSPDLVTLPVGSALYKRHARCIKSLQFEKHGKTHQQTIFLSSTIDRIQIPNNKSSRMLVGRYAVE